jgi:hypothetical protein
MNARFAVKPLTGGIRETPVAGSADGESAPVGYVVVNRTGHETTLREKRGIPAGKMTVAGQKRGIASKIGITHGN